MDPLSIGASALSIHQREQTEHKTDDAFREVIVSCRSLSNYEGNSLRTAVPQAWAAIITASFHIVIGISLAYSAILVPQIESEDSDLKLSTSELSWIASIIVISVPVGCLFAGALMDSIGRLNTIKLAAIPTVMGWIAIAMAQNFYVLLLGRILTGLGGTIGTSPAIVYITEVSRPDLRGSLISICPTLASFGMIIAYAEGSFLNWRLVSWINIIYTIVPIVLVQFFAPESPTWLVSKGRIEDAARSLKYLYKRYPQPDHTNQSMADMHLKALQREHETKLSQKSRNETVTDFASMTRNFWRNTNLGGFTKPTGYKPLIILFWLFLIQQFSGIYITLFYAVTFFQEVGSGIDAYTASIFVGVTRFLMSLCNAWLMKRFKRRQMIMTSSLGMAACMFVSGAFTLWLKQGVTDLFWVPVVCFMFYVCSSMMGLLSIPWTMTAELFPSDIRSLGHSVSYSMANLLMFNAIQSYRSLNDLLGGSHAIQWFFAAVSVVGFFFALFFLPETHGKKLSEIEAYFSGENNKKRKPRGGSIVVTNNRAPKTNNANGVKEAEKMIQDKEKEVV